MRTNRLLTIALAAALTLTVAACGSSGSKTAPALSKPAFIKKADAICKKGDAEISKAAGKVDSKKKSEIEAYYKMAATKSLVQLHAVRALGFPSADADKLDKTLGTFEDAFKKVVKDPSTTEQLSSDKGLKAANKTLSAYGFKRCGNG